MENVQGTNVDALDNKDEGKLLIHTYMPEGDTFPPSVRALWLNGGHANSSLFEAERNGFVQPVHASFELYKKRKYMKSRPNRSMLPELTTEDHVLLDPEADAHFENTHPGTITVEGFALECWDFNNKTPRNMRLLVNSSRLPVVTASKILRRIDELQRTGIFGDGPVDEELNLQEMIGANCFLPYGDPWISGIYSFLNRTDGFADFTDGPSVCFRFMAQPAQGGLGTWSFLRQVVVGKALALRLRTNSADDTIGFTPRILGSLIVSDLWLRHVTVNLTDRTVDWDTVKLPDAASKAETEKWRKRGADAMANCEYQEAVEHYTKAIVADPYNASPRCDRAAAQLAQGNYLEAEEDAENATLLGPKQPKAWSYLGLALLRQGFSRRAEATYAKGLAILSDEDCQDIRQAMADAQVHSRRTITAINEEQDIERQHRLKSDFLAQDYETRGKAVRLASRVHEQQAEGLLLFAQKLQWPYLDEARACVEGAYATVSEAHDVNPHLWDWLYGVVLPGKSFAYTVMCSLLRCTPGIDDRLRSLAFDDSGIVLRDKSYWRSRSVLARVLGCLPGVVSLGGWVGPCPAVRFQDDADAGVQQCVRIKSRDVTPFGPAPVVSRRANMQARPGESPESLLADLKNPNKWVAPPPPPPVDCRCELREVKLGRISADANSSIYNRQGPGSRQRAEYRASVVFQLDSDPSPITYVLYTTPLFVTLPPCQAHDHRQGAGLHKLHERQLPLVQSKPLSIEELNGYPPDDGLGGRVAIINTTGTGEALARAWCSESGRNAVIRRPDGPCLVCALDAADSLRIGVLIWVR